MRIFERFLNILFACDLIPQAVTHAVRLRLVDHFVRYVPGIDLAFVAANDRIDMILQAGVQHFFRYKVVVRVTENPIRRLAVPDERMTANLHVMVLRELDNRIRSIEMELVLHRLRRIPLQVVARRNAREVFRKQIAVRTEHFVVQNRGADREIVREYGLQRGDRRLNRRRRNFNDLEIVHIERLSGRR
ncbi:hypothetical protein D3C84_859910 [compost metagenome]